MMNEDSKREFIQFLKAHNRVIETDDEDTPLPPGVTHILLTREGSDEPELIEKRKMFT